MLMGALCDSCRRPVGGSVTNVQLVTGEVVPSGMTMSLRGTRPPESYNLCDECAAPVYDLIHSGVRNRGLRAS